MKEYEFLLIAFVQNVWMRESHTYNEYNAWGPRKFEGFENPFFWETKLIFQEYFISWYTIFFTNAMQMVLLFMKS